MTDLPAVRGRIEARCALAPLTWLRVGGQADFLFQPADSDDLTAFLRELDPDVPVTPLGVCSNLIIRDGGLPGIAIKLGRAFMDFEVLDGHRVRAGAAMLDSAVAKRASAAGIAGLEFLRTIPGAIGGSVKMNAGCYGSYTADVVESITVITRQGETQTLTPGDIRFSYRSSAIPDDMVITGAILKGRPGDPDVSEALMDDYVAKREASQPTRDRSAGSTFRNPAGYSSTGSADDPNDLKAWKVIDDAGCRGLTLGGAQMSPKHPNFLVNTGTATAADLENLGEEVRRRVKSHSGHDLAWEIRRIGVKVNDP